MGCFSRAAVADWSYAFRASQYAADWANGSSFFGVSGPNFGSLSRATCFFKSSRIFFSASLTLSWSE